MAEFSNTEFLSLLFSCAMPLFDAVSDFLVMWNWATSDSESHYYFFTVALAIHFVSGTISGALFSYWNKEHLPGAATEHGGQFLDGENTRNPTTP